MSSAEAKVCLASSDSDKITEQPIGAVIRRLQPGKVSYFSVHVPAWKEDQPDPLKVYVFKPVSHVPGWSITLLNFLHMIAEEGLYPQVGYA